MSESGGGHTRSGYSALPTVRHFSRKFNKRPDRAATHRLARLGVVPHRRIGPRGAGISSGTWRPPIGIADESTKPALSKTARGSGSAGERVEPRLPRRNACLTTDPDGRSLKIEGPLRAAPAGHGRRHEETHLVHPRNAPQRVEDQPRRRCFKQCSRCGRDGGILANEGIAGRDTLDRGDVSGGGVS